MKPIWMYVDHLNPFFDTDDSGGGGNGDTTNDQNKGGDNNQEPPKTFTQDEVDRIVRTRLTREKDAIRTQVLADLQKKKDDEDAVKRGEFDKLLGEKDAEIQKLAGLTGVIEEYEKLANARYDANIKTLPETIRALAPDEDASALEKDRWWTNKALPALAKWEQESGKTAKRGVNDGNNPPPSKKDKEAYLDDIRKQMQDSGKYNF